MNWKDHSVLITGGASFIGSHLVDALVEKGANVTVADDLSSGRLENISRHLDSGAVTFVQADLRQQEAAERVIAGHETLFHLAADHGGRGYIETHEAACAANLLLDGIVFRACAKNGIARIVYASSGCVYPRTLQADKDNIVRLKEGHVGPPYDADGMYGWAKLMGEMALATYAREYNIKAVSCRYFTAYGPRATESHAVMAMIARAFIKQDPFEVWGTGEQVRNWTYVSDIVEGTLRAAELAEYGNAFNVGTMEGTRVIDAATMVLDRFGHTAKIQTRPDMPTGPYYRIADNGQLAETSGWSPSIRFADGLAKTMDWYRSVHTADEIKARLPDLLLDR